MQVTVKMLRDLAPDSPARPFAGGRGEVVGPLAWAGVEVLYIRFSRYLPTATVNGKRLADYLPEAYKRPRAVILYAAELKEAL